MTMYVKYWFVKEITESFISFILFSSSVRIGVISFINSLIMGKATYSAELKTSQRLENAFRQSIKVNLQ